MLGSHAFRLASKACVEEGMLQYTLSLAAKLHEGYVRTWPQEVCYPRVEGFGNPVRAALSYGEGAPFPKCHCLLSLDVRDLAAVNGI